MKMLNTFFAIACAVTISNLFVSTVSAQSDTRQPDRTVFMSLNSETNAWDSSSSQTYQFDNFNRVTVKKGYRFVDDQNVENQITHYTYNSAGQETEKIEQFIFDGEVTDQARTTTEYDIHGNQISNIDEAWLEGAWKILRGYKSAYTYGQDNQVTEVIESEYNEETTTWDFKSRSVVSYQNGKPLTVQAYTWTDGKWKDDMRMANLTFFNDVFDMENAKMTSADMQYNIGGIWITVMRLKASFTSDGKELTNSTENFDITTGKWQVSSKDSSAYDAQGNITLKLSSDLNEENGSWMEYGERHTYEYNSDNTIHTDITEQMNSSAEGWINTGKKVNFYSAATGIENEESTQVNPNVFPNPASENIFISNAEGEVTLFNQSGQKVWSGISTGSNLQIDASQFPSGQYIVKIESRKGVQSQKLIIAR